MTTSRIAPRLDPDALAAARAPLARATTLPPRCYVDPQFYALEEERIFHREWLVVGRADQIPEPGDYLAFDLLGEPLVAVRDLEGEVRVLSRVCRHRWMPVVEGRGKRRSFQCPYHLWTYALDGRLLGAPEMERAQGFERASCRLPALRVELFEGWIFTSFDPEAAPLAPRLEGLRRAIAPYRVGDFRSTEPIRFEHAWNWKVLVDNFIESYHHAGPHRDTLQPIVPATGTFAEDSDGPWAVLRNPTSDGSPVPALFDETPGLCDAERGQFVVGAVFPLHLFSVQRDSMVWYELRPRGVARLDLAIHVCTPPGKAGDAEHAFRVETLRSFVDQVHRQDIQACDGVQAGLRSRYAEPGRFSHLEKALWQLARFVLDRVDGGTGEPRS